MIATISSVIRSRGGRGKAGLVELREYRSMKREFREEDNAEASIDQRPRWPRRGETPKKFLARLHKWESEEAVADRKRKRLNNVFALRKERAGVPVPLAP